MNFALPLTQVWSGGGGVLSLVLSLDASSTRCVGLRWPLLQSLTVKSAAPHQNICFCTCVCVLTRKRKQCCFMALRSLPSLSPGSLSFGISVAAAAIIIPSLLLIADTAGSQQDTPARSLQHTHTHTCVRAVCMPPNLLCVEQKLRHSHQVVS